MKQDKSSSCLGERYMSEAEKYEEFRRYFERGEEREQQYIVTITKQSMRIKELECELKKVGVQNG